MKPRWVSLAATDERFETSTTACRITALMLCQLGTSIKSNFRHFRQLQCSYGLWRSEKLEYQPDPSARILAISA